MMKAVKLNPKDEGYVAICNANDIPNADELVALVASWIDVYCKATKPIFNYQNNSVFAARIRSIIDDIIHLKIKTANIPIQKFPLLHINRSQKHQLLHIQK